MGGGWSGWWLGRRQPRVVVQADKVSAPGFSMIGLVGTAQSPVRLEGWLAAAAKPGGLRVAWSAVMAPTTTLLRGEAGWGVQGGVESWATNGRKAKQPQRR